MLERVKFLRRMRRKYQLQMILPRISRDLVMHIEREQTRGVFVDCGSNLGQGLQFFSELFRPKHFDYELFEPNPNCKESLHDLIDKLKPVSARLHEKAVSVSSEKATFYGVGLEEDSRFSQGASLRRDHNSRYQEMDDEAILEVESIDFAEYIKSLSNEYKYIVVKLDIEGMECDVLEHLLRTGAYVHVAAIFCEFHGEYLSASQRNNRLRREASVRRALGKVGCKVLDWV